MNCKKCEGELEFRLQKGKERDGLFVVCPKCGQIARYRLREYDYDCYPPKGFDVPKDTMLRPFEKIEDEEVEVEQEPKPKKKFEKLEKIADTPKQLLKKMEKVKTTPEKLERVEKQKETML